MKKIFLVVLTILLSLSTFSGNVFASTPTVVRITDVAQIDFSEESGTNKMIPHYNPTDGTFEKVTYIVKSTGATSGTRYRTKAYTFQVGTYGPATFDASQLRTDLPAQGETTYDQVTMDRDFFKMLLGAHYGPDAIEDALNSEKYLQVGAVIEIYNASTGAVRDTFYSKSDCDRALSIGFPASDVTDMKTRWQNVKLQLNMPPDFFSTPEGSDTWDSSYATCAKTYPDVEPGQEFTFPITLHNSGVKKETTDFKALWYGTGAAGLANPVWDGGKVELAPGEFKTFAVTVTAPAANAENRLVFVCNTDGQTPSSEENRENNITIIRIGQPDCDLAVKFIVPFDGVKFSAMSGKSQNAGAKIKVTRLDSGTADVPAVITWTLPDGSIETEDITAAEGYSDIIDKDFTLSSPGDLTISVEIEPTGIADSDESNNTDSKSFTFKWESVGSIGSDDGIYITGTHLQ